MAKKKNKKEVLTEKQVRALRLRYDTGKYSYVDLGFSYGISPTQARNIVLRYSWKGVQ